MKPYIPQIMPLNQLDWSSLVGLIGTANAALARYDGILQGIVNLDVLMSPLTTQEAVVSSKIEGTIATLEDVLEFEASPPKELSEKEMTIQEIVNYRSAMRFAVDKLRTLPITLNLIKETHSILMKGVRGRDKGRGQFRMVQNWIGIRKNAPMEDATFVPPEPRLLKDSLSNLEKYINYTEKDPLVQLAIVHAQFELIHPFVDGNGRVGRILIPLFLYEKRLLPSPMFYLSEYLEAHREIYYEQLQTISVTGDWSEWITFFLTAITEQA